MVGNKIDQLDDEHDEQPLRRKPEETELPVECLQSEWALNNPRAAAVDSNRFLRVLVPLPHLQSAISIDTNKSGVIPTKGSSTSRSRFARTLRNVRKSCSLQPAKWHMERLPKGVQLSTMINTSDAGQNLNRYCLQTGSSANAFKTFTFKLDSCQDPGNGPLLRGLPHESTVRGLQGFSWVP